MLLVKDLFSFVIWLFYIRKYYRTSVLVRVLKLFYTKKNSKKSESPLTLGNDNYPTFS